MLSVGNNLVGGGASLPLEARVAVGAGVFAVGAAETSAPVAEAPVVNTPGQRLPAYNAFEFTYRPDFGKIILLHQNVETGQALTQIPTEYHLRQYAASQREQRVQLQQKLYRGSGGVEQQSPAAPVAVAATAAPSASPSDPSAPPASPSAAPSTAAAAATHVDIKA